MRLLPQGETQKLVQAMWILAPFFFYTSPWKFQNEIFARCPGFDRHFIDTQDTDAVQLFTKTVSSLFTTCTLASMDPGALTGVTHHVGSLNLSCQNKVLIPLSVLQQTPGSLSDDFVFVLCFTFIPPLEY